MKNKVRQVRVQQHKVGWGLTDGSKWFFYAYPTQQAAENMVQYFSTQEKIAVNISYPEPLKLVHQAHTDLVVGGNVCAHPEK